jgi:hypothetical protein
VTALVFLGGEGPNELGSRARHPSYNDDQPGVIEALLRRVQEQGWAVSGAVTWSRIRKFQARGPTPREERNVLGFVLEAKRAGAHIAAFLRDADDDAERLAVIKAAITRARELYPDVDVIGGVAVPVLEAWLLALSGEAKTERLGKAAAQSRLAARGVPEKSTAAMVQIVRDARIDSIPVDAAGLRTWLKTAEEVLRTHGGT